MFCSLIFHTIRHELTNIFWHSVITSYIYIIIYLASPYSVYFCCYNSTINIYIYLRYIYIFPRIFIEQIPTVGFAEREGISIQQSPSRNQRVYSDK